MATRTTISPPLAFPGHSPVCPSLKSTVSLSQVPGEGQETATCNILGDLAVVLGLGTEARGQLLVCALLMRTFSQMKPWASALVAGLPGHGLGPLFCPFHFHFHHLHIIYNRHKLIWRFYSDTHLYVNVLVS